MKALTICQPHAHLMNIGKKRGENRTWRTRYRGPFAIHAGLSRSWLSPGDLETYPDLVFGAVIGVAELTDCISIDCLSKHLNWTGPFCFVIDNARPLPEPIPCRGKQGLWTLPSDVEVAIRASGIEMPA